MVQLQDRQIKTPTVLRHRKVNTIFLDLLPLKSKRLGFSEASKQEKFKEHAMDWVVQIIDCSPPILQVTNDPTI